MGLTRWIEGVGGREWPKRGCVVQCGVGDGVYLYLGIPGHRPGGYAATSWKSDCRKSFQNNNHSDFPDPRRSPRPHAAALETARK